MTFNDIQLWGKKAQSTFTFTFFIVFINFLCKDNSAYGYSEKLLLDCDVIVPDPDRDFLL